MIVSDTYFDTPPYLYRLIIDIYLFADSFCCLISDSIAVICSRGL